MNMRGSIASAVVFTLLASASLLAEGKKSPENPSILLFVGGSVVAAWHYFRAKLRR
jgi:hypothetical protein